MQILILVAALMLTLGTALVTARGILSLLFRLMAKMR